MTVTLADYVAYYERELCDERPGHFDRVLPQLRRFLELTFTTAEHFERLAAARLSLAERIEVIRQIKPEMTELEELARFLGLSDANAPPPRLN